ncbi:hypothetical protein [Flavobacterium sp. SLB02]|uniref:hypothetical protein n=1 Tax=Flavobacterium sp. SLB02 TaxID=2665645 RepID=UPI0012A875CB|nr:hypothetical protein [Flavobacterium sp. SLB02]QGK77118.1 hypothetical protein GIY83_24540 [Flavobacterium sp. SLB02]
MKRTFFLFAISLFCLTGFSQNADLFKTEGITGELHQSNIGKVTFMDGNIPLDQYKKTDFLQSFNLTYKSNLNIRIFLDNSITNYLHELAPNLSADKLVETGNLQFAFYIDNKFIYKDNINSGCNFGYGSSKNTSTALAIPLTSSKAQNLWSLHMWDRFKLNGGEKALTNGTHTLRIEVRPYIITNKDNEAIVGNLIAKGQIKLIIKTPKVTAKQMEIQQIVPNSGWEISDFQFDKKKNRIAKQGNCFLQPKRNNKRCCCL